MKQNFHSNRTIFLILSMLSLIGLFSGCTKKETVNWPQYRGPERTGISHETGLMQQWPDQGPELLWTAENIGPAYASPAVADGIIYITGKKDSLEYLTALNTDGKQLYQKSYGKAWHKSFSPSRCTPTVDSNRVYLISGQGEVVCLNASDGEKIWSIPAFERYQGETGIWGIAESPLVVDDKVIYTPGGNQTTMIALDKMTGQELWKTESLNDYTAYVSPILITMNGMKTIVNVTANYVLGVNAENGEIRWQNKYTDIETPLWHENAPYINCVSPLFSGNRLYVTSGYNHVGVQYEINETNNALNVVWIDSTLDTHHGGVVLVDGYIYGSNWIDNKTGNWCCVDWATGKLRYDTEWKTKGSVIFADNRLYCYEEKSGHVALVEPTSEKFNIVSSFKISGGKGPHWSHPAIANGVLYIRHGDVLMAYEVKR